MKRAPELRDLSEDHHQGLVIAVRAKRAAAGDGESASAAWGEAARRFAAELEPHFEIEEAFLAPVLETIGEARLAERLREEHGALRRFFEPGAARTSAELQSFGELLERHIRFEERELFEVAQQKMSPAALQAVAEACAARRERGTNEAAPSQKEHDAPPEDSE